jgi:hypothetical protein
MLIVKGGRKPRFRIFKFKDDPAESVVQEADNYEDAVAILSEGMKDINFSSFQLLQRDDSVTMPRLLQSHYRSVLGFKSSTYDWGEQATKVIWPDVEGPFVLCNGNPRAVAHLPQVRKPTCAESHKKALADLPEEQQYELYETPEFGLVTLGFNMGRDLIDIATDEFAVTFVDGSVYDYTTSDSYTAEQWAAFVEAEAKWMKDDDEDAEPPDATGFK